MGFRFYRRIKVIPGVTLNVSKAGLSTSVGVKGAHMTLGNGNERTTVGITPRKRSGRRLVFVSLPRIALVACLA
jgi:hypothetical protein